MFRFAFLPLVALASTPAAAQDDDERIEPVAPSIALQAYSVSPTVDGLSVDVEWGDAASGTAALYTADGALLDSTLSDGVAELALDWTAASAADRPMVLVLTGDDGSETALPVAVRLDCTDGPAIDCTPIPELGSHFSRGTVTASEALQDWVGVWSDEAGDEGFDLLERVRADAPHLLGDALAVADVFTATARTDDDPRPAGDDDDDGAGGGGDGLPDPLPCECFRFDSGQSILDPSTSIALREWPEHVLYVGSRGIGAALDFNGHLMTRHFDATDETEGMNGQETVRAMAGCWEVHFRLGAPRTYRHPITNEVLGSDQTTEPYLVPCSLDCSLPDAEVIGFGAVEQDVQANKSGTSTAIAAATTDLSFRVNGASAWAMHHHDEAESRMGAGGERRDGDSYFAPHRFMPASGNLTLTFEAEGQLRNKGAGQRDEAVASLQTSYAWAAYAPANACTDELVLWGTPRGKVWRHEHCDNIEAFFGGHMVSVDCK